MLANQPIKYVKKFYHKSIDEVKNVCKMSQVDRLNFKLQFDLDIEWVLIPQTIIDISSKVNILSKSTWMKLGHPELVKSDFYLNLANQDLVEPLGIRKYVETTIMGISTRIDFEVIEPKLGSNPYLAMVGRP